MLDLTVIFSSTPLKTPWTKFESKDPPNKLDTNNYALGITFKAFSFNILPLTKSAFKLRTNIKFFVTSLFLDGASYPKYVGWERYLPAEHQSADQNNFAAYKKPTEAIQQLLSPKNQNTDFLFFIPTEAIQQL